MLPSKDHHNQHCAFVLQGFPLRARPVHLLPGVARLYLGFATSKRWCVGVCHCLYVLLRIQRLPVGNPRNHCSRDSEAEGKQHVMSFGCYSSVGKYRTCSYFSEVSHPQQLRGQLAHGYKHGSFTEVSMKPDTSSTCSINWASGSSRSN